MENQFEINESQNGGEDCAFPQCGTCRRQGYPKISEAAVRTCSAKQLILKITENSQ